MRYCQQSVPASEYEIVFVDDGSSDETAAIVSRYPAVRLLKLGVNRGPAAARNAGLREARGDIILFTDADCAPAADWVEAMRRPFRDPEVAGCKGVYRTGSAGWCRASCNWNTKAATRSWRGSSTSTL